jgi:hypothetical protein
VPRAFRRPRHHPKPIIDCYPDDPSLVFYDNIPEHVRSLVDYTPVYDLIDQGPAHLSLAALTDYAQRLEAVLLALHAQLSARHGIDLVPPIIRVLGNRGVMLALGPGDWSLGLSDAG